jgi:hypothetical protein
MENFLIIVGGVGVACALASLIAIGSAAAGRGHWGVVAGCLAAFSVILALVLFGIEYQSTFWEGK